MYAIRLLTHREGVEAVLSSINTFTDAWQKRTEAVEGILQK